MIDAGAWEAFNALAAIVILLGSLAFALQRLGIIRRTPPPAAAVSAPADNEGRLVAVEAQISDVGQALARLGGRVDVIEKAIPAIAGDLRAVLTQVNGLAVGVAEVGGDVKALRERTDAVLRTVDRHERFLYRGQADGIG